MITVHLENPSSKHKGGDILPTTYVHVHNVLHVYRAWHIGYEY